MYIHMYVAIQEKQGTEHQWSKEWLFTDSNVAMHILLELDEWVFQTQNMLEKQI